MRDSNYNYIAAEGSKVANNHGVGYRNNYIPHNCDDGDGHGYVHDGVCGDDHDALCLLALM